MQDYSLLLLRSYLFIIIFICIVVVFTFCSLLQLLAGLCKPTSGSIHVQRYDKKGLPAQPPGLLFPERVGIVFQFPERY